MLIYATQLENKSGLLLDSGQRQPKRTCPHSRTDLVLLLELLDGGDQFLTDMLDQVLGAELGLQSLCSKRAPARHHCRR
jgi:hypothetical protein